MKLAECLLSRGAFIEAEMLLSKSDAAQEAAGNPPTDLRVYLIQTYVKLYEAWHAGEPAQDHDAQAATWRAKLDSLSSAITD
jgi:hypothetical protein